ncbi:redoxin domain-containing protein [Pontibacter toksunensis]|uniref:Redoxin domain-containing protein n=1 Tax=Pontibacter toksunensis TaxID=1332631 RepID=A0ABW6BVL4_9BACT
MKKALIRGSLLFALLGLYPATQTLAQKATTVEGSKVEGAKAQTLQPVKIASPAVAPVKAETVTLKPAKAAPAPVKVSTVSVKGATPVTAAKATTIVKATAGGGEELSKEEVDSLIKAGVIKTMTHEEIEDHTRKREERFLMMVNKPAPAFTATDLSGKTYALEQLKGKTVVLNFWFIGCKPCIMEMPHLNEVVQKYKQEDVVFLAFALDQEEELRKFLAKTPFNYNIVPDANRISRDAYGVNAFPTSLVIDKDGILRDYLTGYSEDVGEKLSKMIEKARQQQ